MFLFFPFHNIKFKKNKTDYAPRGPMDPGVAAECNKRFSIFLEIQFGDIKSEIHIKYWNVHCIIILLYIWNIFIQNRNVTCIIVLLICWTFKNWSRDIIWVCQCPIVEYCHCLMYFLDHFTEQACHHLINSYNLFPY